MRSHTSLHVTACLAVAVLALPNHPTAAGLLPDIAGIRLGTPVQEAYRLIKAHDPGATVEIVNAPQMPLVAKPVPSRFALTTVDGSESMNVDFTQPPNAQVVWKIVRTLNFQRGKEPTLANTVAALREKYGPESFVGRSDRLPDYFWVLTEQGSRVPGANRETLGSCGGTYLPAIGQGDRTLYIPPVRMPELCRSLVVVRAMAQRALAPDTIEALNVLVENTGLQLRAAQATNTAIDSANAARQKEERNREDQRGKPKL